MIIGYDTETAVSERTTLTPKGVKYLGLQCPPTVCVSFAGLGEAPEELIRASEEHYIDRDASGYWRALLPAHAGAELVSDLVHMGHTLVAHNGAFDVANLWNTLDCAGMDVSPLLDALESGRLRCTYVRELLLAVAFGYLDFDHRIGRKAPGFSLADTAKARLGVEVAGKEEDGWRLRYAELLTVPICEWPKAAIEYALIDAVTVHAVYTDQCQGLSTPQGVVTDLNGDITNEREQTLAAFALYLCTVNGPRTHPQRVAEFAATHRAIVAESEIEGQRLGIVRPNGTKDTKALAAIVMAHYGDNYPRTPAGKVQCDADALEPITALAKWREGDTSRKLVSTYVPLLESGTEVPITARARPLVATGRCSWDSGMHGPPRAGNYRECFVPRPGNVFSSTDYNQIELAAVAQTELDWFGRSRMADVINAGTDCHTDFAMRIAESQEGGRTYTYTEALSLVRAKDERWTGPHGYRQLAKIGNFGFNGGMGKRSFPVYAHRNYGVEMTEDEADDLRNLWLQTYPEKALYFARIAGYTRMGRTFTAIQPVSLRQRAECNFCDGANTYFQGRAADGAKAALWAVWREILTDERPSTMCDVRPWLMLHDEIIAEGPEETAHVWGPRIAEIMIREMKHYIPDVRVSAETALMRTWQKKADPVYVNGKLTPWEPK